MLSLILHYLRLAFIKSIFCPNRQSRIVVIQLKNFGSNVIILIILMLLSNVILIILKTEEDDDASRTKGANARGRE